MKMDRCMPAVDVIVETQLFPCALFASLQALQSTDRAMYRTMVVKKAGLYVLMTCLPDCGRPLSFVLPCSDPIPDHFLETG